MKNKVNMSRNYRAVSPKGRQPEIGIVEWFRVGEYEHVERTVDRLRELNITELRTGVSWADSYTTAGKKWFEWLMPTLGEKLNVLPCFLYTPPSIGIAPKTSSPPKEPKAYADFLDMFVKRYGQYFEWVELWNEPNNRSEYDYTLDPYWETFNKMVGGAAYWAHQLGKKTLLGGMSPIDPNWLGFMCQSGTLDHFDAIGIHGFPDVFDTHWEGWNYYIDKIGKVFKNYDKEDIQLWITEAGFSTWQHDERRQFYEFLQLLEVPVKRAYWYAMEDLDPQQATVDGYHLDEREYSFGLTKTDGAKKLLYRLWKDRGLENIKEDAWMSTPYVSPNRSSKSTLITGGAGFIGTNLAHNLLSSGKKVTILDNLSRPGVENNLRWLRSMHSTGLEIEIADVRDKQLVHKLVQSANQVFHFAAQVAVTTSLDNPMHDFNVNMEGSLNVLEAIRKSENKPPMIFTSTNKVYGNLQDVLLSMTEKRYFPSDDEILETGIDEERPLDFHSPYGCSKGSADQYILDYARSFKVDAVVFRMSCIYGPHQCGTEDQGWVAHFLIQALKDQTITIYGDGKQVRDILFVEDLVNAFLSARENMDELSGQAFNIGGGTKNTVSLLELIEIIRKKTGKEIDVEFGKWRTGDQKYYVSDISRFCKATGWAPKCNVEEGVYALYEWLKSKEKPSAKVKKLKTIAAN